MSDEEQTKARFAEYDRIARQMAEHRYHTYPRRWRWVDLTLGDIARWLVKPFRKSSGEAGEDKK